MHDHGLWRMLAVRGHGAAARVDLASETLLAKLDAKIAWPCQRHIDRLVRKCGGCRKKGNRKEDVENLRCPS